MPHAMPIEPPAPTLASRMTGVLRRAAQAQTMFGIPLIIILFVLHLGLSNTGHILLQSQYDFHQSSTALLKSTFAMQQSLGALQVAAASHDASTLPQARALLIKSLNLLHHDAQLAPRSQVLLAEPLLMTAHVTELESLIEALDAEIAALRPKYQISNIPLLLDRLNTLDRAFRELQSQYDQAILMTYNKLTSQQKHYAWAVRSALLLLLLLYGSLIWIYISQRTSNRKLHDKLDRAEHATRVKSNFLTMMSHAIRTPLNNIISITALLNRTTLDKQQGEHVTLIRHNSGHLVRIAKDVLDFSHIEGEQISLTEEPFTLRDIITDANVYLTDGTHQKISLEVDIGDDVPTLIVGDRARYAQLLTNLLGNALKGDHQGHIMLDVDVTDREELVIRVRNTSGNTAEPDALNSTSPPLSQITQTPTHTHTHNDSGLGLAMTHHLVELMRGDIAVRNLPGGTEFMVHLPLTRPNPFEETEQNNADTTPARRDLKILVVEDNPVNQLVTGRMLESLGNHVDIAIDGREGVNLARKGHYDLILMDLQMPYMSGIEATREIMRHSQAARIVALSANALPEHRAAATEAGMSGFLVKPARLHDIEKLLGQLFPIQKRTPSTQA